jgi:GNAT superfamily N-acetyltransferase
VTVRAARVADLPALLDMARAMHAESVYCHLAYDEARVAAQFVGWMGGKHVWFNVYDAGRSPVGFFVGVVGFHWFSPDKGAWDKLLYVKPESRGGFAAYRLFDAFRVWARGQGALDVWPGVSTGSAAGVAFYRRMGGQEIGALFRFDLNSQ